MKYTLLQMVQNIMSAMDSDDVTSINDTPEALQVATEIKNTYDLMVSNQIIPEAYELTRLDSVNQTDHPNAKNYLAIPDEVAETVWVKYDFQTEGDTFEQFSEVPYLDPREFMDLVGKNRSDLDNTTQVTDPTSGVTYYVTNDQHPRHYTSFDDKYFAFDSYDASVDTVSMVGSKSQTWAKLVPSWTMSDSFTPPIDDNLFPYLIAEAKSTCFVNLKQQANPKVEKQSLEQRIRLQNHRYRSKGNEKARTGSTGPNYGRGR